MRPASRSGGSASVDTMKVAGILFIVSAVISFVIAFVGKEAGRPVSGSASTLGSSFVVLIFGAGLYQGVGAVRGLVLVCAALGALATATAVALLNSIRELQLLALAVLLTCIGYLVLLLRKEASRARVALALGLIGVGAIGSLGAPLWLSSIERRVFGRELRPLLADEREYTNAASGLSLKAPAGWNLMRGDAGIFKSVPAKVRLADPDAGTVAFINDETKPPRLLSLDHYLDGVIEAQKEGGLEPRQKDRSDVTVGKAPARRMSLSWTHDGRPYSGFVSAWLDGPRIFTLFGAAVGSWSASTQERFGALEASLRFSAPVETALSAAQSQLTAECPVFTPDAVRMIARKIPPASSADTYFRTGWSWAIRGQSEIDTGAAAELRDLMANVFSRMSGAERSRFATYSERLRSGQATTATDDVAAMRILGKAAAALPAADLARLQVIVDTSVTVGGLL